MLASDCLAELRFERVPKVLSLLEFNVQMSRVLVVHMYKWFEYRKKPRNVSISKVEVVT